MVKHSIWKSCKYVHPFLAGGIQCEITKTYIDDRMLLDFRHSKEHMPRTYSFPLNGNATEIYLENFGDTGKYIDKLDQSSAFLN